MMVGLIKMHCGRAIQPSLELLNFVSENRGFIETLGREIGSISNPSDMQALKIKL